MSYQWWALLIFGIYAGYHLKVLASKDPKSTLVGLDSGVIIGSLLYFIGRIIQLNQEASKSLEKK